MTELRGTDDSGRVADPLTPETLRPLLQEASASVLVQARADPSATQALATRADGGRWRVQVRSGGGDALVATVPNTDAAFDALRSWAADDGWWLEAFSWSPAGSAEG